MIKCNNKPRNFTYGYELSKNELLEFDYIPSDEIMLHEFIRYKGRVYDVSEFMRAESEQFKGWDGYISDSFFSGVLIKIIDSDSCIVARYCS